MQVLKKISSYWWCQIAGWTANASLSFFFAWTFGRAITNTFLFRVIILTILGLAITHLMRLLLKQLNVLQKALDKQAIYFIATTLGFALLYSFILQSVFLGLNLLDERERSFNFTSRLSINVINSSVTLLVWNLIYFIYHYIQRIRNQQIESLQAESLIRELQLQTIKSHINPHFIFNALNSIRALVDENPSRARTAITELSNILRNSMAEKVETVPFEKELNIVKDYLALEQMRFEERLKIKLEIDEDTLEQPVPPMMLQTLVENAIKHGISKNISGGEITIVSKFSDFHHELIVRNTGSINGIYNADGFGISSTQNRLKLMFGEKANFSLLNTSTKEVEATVQMPVDL